MDYTKSVDLARALQAYSLKSDPKKGTGISSATSSVSSLIQAANLRKASFNKLFPAMFSIHGLDVVTSLNRATADGDITKRAADIVLEAFNISIKELANKYGELSQSLLLSTTAKLDEFVRIFNSGNGDINSNMLRQMDAILNDIKLKFKSPLVVQYIEGSSNRSGSLKLAFTSFDNLRDQVNRTIKKNIDLLVKTNKITNSKITDATYVTTKVFNWGHTQTTTGEASQIITGKLIAELINLDNIPIIDKDISRKQVYDVIAKDFIVKTGQANVSIKLHHGSLTKGDPEVLRLVVESGYFQSAIVQNRRENQQDLSQEEAAWHVLHSLDNNAFLRRAFGVPDLRELVNKLLKVRSSPSILEKIATNIENTILGKSIVSGQKTINLLNVTKDIKKKVTKVALKQNTGPKVKTGTLTKAPETGITLTSLQALLDKHLQDVISANMGNGGERRVLNYRTGRLAASAKVERLTQSREGVITAFYTYMKNPYATFSDGGRQQYPKTRDPKLLISGAIREIAATQAITRLRSVLI